MNTELQSELDQLVGDLLDDRLTTEQAARLRELVESSDAASAYYFGVMRVHAGLVWKHGAIAVAQSQTENVEPREQVQPTLATASTKVSLAPSASPSRQHTPSPLARPLRGLVEDFARQPLAAMLLCGAIVAAALVAWQMPRGQQNKVARDTQNQEARDDIQAGKQQRDAIENDGPSRNAQRPVIARLGSTHNAKWASQQASRGWAKGESFVSGDRLVLERGLAEIVYHTGATVLLEGPAELEIGGTRQAAANACSLALGKLVARVPESAHGFTVVTPTLTIIDKGTEFGVLVRNKDEGGRMKDEREQVHPSSSILPSSVTEVQVIEGRVVVEQQVPDHVAQVPPPKQIELSAGEGVVAEPNTEAKKTTDATHTNFVRKLPTKTPLLPLATWPADSPLKPGDIVAVSNASKRFHLFKIDPTTGKQTKLATGFPFRQAPADHGLQWCSMAVERDGHVLVGAKGIGAKNAGVLRIDPRDGSIKVLSAGGLLTQGSITGLAVSSDGTIYAAYDPNFIGETDYVLAINPISGQVTQLERFGNSIRDLCFDTNGHDLMTTSSDDSKVGVVRLAAKTTVTTWSLETKIGRLDAVVVDPTGRILVGTALHQDAQSLHETIYEVGRDHNHAIKTVAEMHGTPNPGAIISMACEANGKLIVGPQGEKCVVSRIDLLTGKTEVVSSGDMITPGTFLAVVPSRTDLSAKHRK